MNAAITGASNVSSISKNRMKQFREAIIDQLSFQRRQRRARVPPHSLKPILATCVIIIFFFVQIQH